MEETLLWIALNSFLGAGAGYLALVRSDQVINFRSRAAALMDGAVAAFVVSCVFSRYLTTGWENALVVSAGAVVTALVGGLVLDQIETILGNPDEKE